ncbi:hypothetical protein GCM10009533_43630 [Saccharopolyspora spinosporotrichia]|uniref:Uncharacterized protein n=1 Tax=Saccharopolyspora erythraea TaxID=1836 RepID=A0ABN1DC30_SACER
MGVDEERDRADIAGVPSAVCFTCGGFRKVSEPRIYLIQATADMWTGMTMGEWRTCPQCTGEGQLPGVRPPL